MKDRMIDEVYRYESQIESQINQDFEMMNTMAAFFGSAENITDEEYFKIIQNVDEENDFVTLGVFDTQGKGLILDRDAHKVYDLSIDDLPEDVKDIVQQLYSFSPYCCYQTFQENGEDDFSFSLANIGRFRVNVYRQRNSEAAVLRVVKFELPDPKKFHIPNVVLNLADQKKVWF